MIDRRIPWWEPKIGPKEHELVTGVLNSSYVNEGNLAFEFEDKIAALVGSKHAITATSCTSALFLALKALGVGPGDEVIVPDMTFIATANAVSLCGATPILVDVNPADLTMSVPAMVSAITPRTKAIMPVHVTGRAANLKEIIKIAKEHSLFVVEDAAEALMSKYEGKFLGTLGDAGCFSFSPNKTITTGQGGVVVTDNPELNVKIRELKDQGRPVRGTGGNDRHDVVGYNFKFTNLQAAVGLGQLEYLDERVSRMRHFYKLYSENLRDIPDLHFYPCDLENGAVPQWTDVYLDKRDELVAYLLEKNIDSRKYWYPLHTQKAYLASDDQFPASTKTSPQSLWLPSAYTLTDEEINYVCQEIRNFFGA